MTENKFIGKWKIVEMDGWDLKAIDLVEPGYFQFDGQTRGSLHFICIYADISYALGSGNKKAVFSFHGDEEGNDISGRGWATIKKNELHGHIYINHGDESGFIARLMA